MHDRSVETSFPGKKWAISSTINGLFFLLASFRSLSNCFRSLTDIVWFLLKLRILFNIVWVVLFHFCLYTSSNNIKWCFSVNEAFSSKKVSNETSSRFDNSLSALNAWMSCFRPHLFIYESSEFWWFTAVSVRQCPSWLGRTFELLFKRWLFFRFNFSASSLSNSWNSWSLLVLSEYFSFSCPSIQWILKLFHS